MDVGHPHFPVRQHADQLAALQFPQHAERARRYDPETSHGRSGRALRAVEHDTPFDPDRGRLPVFPEHPPFRPSTRRSDDDGVRWKVGRLLRRSRLREIGRRGRRTRGFTPIFLATADVSASVPMRSATSTESPTRSCFASSSMNSMRSLGCRFAKGDRCGSTVLTAKEVRRRPSANREAHPCRARRGSPPQAQ